MEPNQIKTEVGNSFLKRNLVIIIALLLPLILILGVALLIYIPSLRVSTAYNFIYATCGSDYYGCSYTVGTRFSVVDNKLVIKPINPDQDLNYNKIPDIQEDSFKLENSLRLFLHDTKTNQSREITVAQAEALNLSSLITSPDGATVSSSYSRSGGDFMFFGGSYQSGYYLMRGNAKKKMNLINGMNAYYSPGNFEFIGWTL